jgi:ribulose 1,5-bisphosphate carboxylase large subunit-like protein
LQPQKFTSIAQTGDAIVASMIKPIGEYAALRNIVINELRSEVFCSGNPGQAINETRNDVVQSLYALEDFSAGNLSTLRTEIFGNVSSEKLIDSL